MSNNYQSLYLKYVGSEAPNLDDIFYKKYIMYKQKYLALKNQLGGWRECLRCHTRNSNTTDKCQKCQNNLFGPIQADESVLKISVQNMAGDVLKVTLPLNATCANLKTAIHNAWRHKPNSCDCAGCELVPERQRIAIMPAAAQANSEEEAPVILENRHTLVSYGLTDGMTVHLFIEPPLWEDFVDDLVTGDYFLDSLENKYGGEIFCSERWRAAYAHSQKNPDDPKWQSVRAMCLANGFGGVKNETDAVSWWQRAAAQDYGFALDQLGFHYLQGVGIPKDEARAVQLFQRAIDLGYGHALTQLGHCYINGLGIPKDVARGVEMQRRSQQEFPMS
jgi:hypothetical protein